LNHEFLADQAVLHKGAIMPSYQNLVLAFSSNAIAPSLANPIHYSSIKKRIVIMKTHTSQKAIWLRSLLLLPLLALLLYSFSTKEFVEIEKTAERTTLSEHQNVKPPSTEINNVSIFQSIKKPEITILINRNGQLLMEGDLVKIDHLKSHLRNYNQHLTKEERSQLVRAIIRVDKDTPSSTIKKVASILMDYGVATVDIRERFEQQEKATKKEVKEYNELAKKYNARPKNQQLIKEKDVQRMEYIYNRMSDTQKRNAQPFPNFPPPPPKAPKTPKTPKAKLDSKIPPPPPPAPAPPTPKVNEDRKSNIPPPPPPTKNPNQGNYSNILIESYKKFNNKANTYAQAVGAYKREGEGTLLNLQTLYEETMVLYDDYVDLAKKEGLLSPTKATPKDHE
ncbi:MAG: biopolymer transporter ExbD, partial [Arenibacter sp.]|nr:biopolymer transporter ExbD [Arenibacter sp.]